MNALMSITAGQDSDARTYTSDGALATRDVMRTSANGSTQRLEASGYSALSLPEWYSLRGDASAAGSMCTPDATLSPQHLWRYRYGPQQEREQKREWENGTATQPLHWTYWLLGADGKQLATYHGVQGATCGGAATDVALWPVEYAAYAPLGTRVITRSNGAKEIVLADHLGSSRVVLAQQGYIAQSTAYTAYGEISHSEGDGARTGYIGRFAEPEVSFNLHGVRFYDHDQRITSVSSSRDGVTWEHEAAYAYFAHGPLKRMELGQDSVQGIDYAYTINGWLKGINMPSLSPDHDPGGDGASTGPNTGFARDAFGMILGYHEKDFVKTGSVYDSSHSATSSWHVPAPTFLYNGNISSWAYNSRRASGASDTAMASVYRYDLLNRIRTDSTRLRGATAWGALSNHWHSSYTYDGNGNIKTLYRADATGSQMDNLTYSYTTGTNKLINIDDYEGASTGADIGDQSGNNYAYDATGNMTQDTAAGIEAGGIVWSPYNKIKSITKMGEDTTSKLVYLYDAAGNRILKRYYKPYNTLKSTTWYVRDAQGNTLATYTKPSDSTTARQTEVMLYGSTRLAVAETHAPYSDSDTDTLGIFDRVSSRMLGQKRYELTDHLGNVRATVSDVVIDHSGNLDAEITSRTDYYPFGMIMGGRNSSMSDVHRYGFNGKENDNEVKGEGVQQDYGFRIYDARVARFLSVDPLSAEYPSISTYVFAENSCLAGIDLDGLEFYFAADGRYLGHDKQSNMVVLADELKVVEEVNESTKEITQKLVPVNPKPLEMSMTKFTERGATVYGESSVGFNIEDWKELFAIASVHKRNQTAYGNKSKQANLFRSTDDKSRNGTFMQVSFAAVINAELNGHDYSNGATGWDGAEQTHYPETDQRGSTGKYELHMNTMGWTIHDDHFKSWKAAVNNMWSEYFQAPQHRIAPQNYPEKNMYNKGLSRLESTAQYGLTIFWKTRSKTDSKPPESRSVESTEKKK